MNPDKIFLLIISLFLRFISCNLDLYQDLFSIPFYRAYKKFNKENNHNDECMNILIPNDIYSEIFVGESKNKIQLFYKFNSSNITINANNLFSEEERQKKSNNILRNNKITFAPEVFLNNCTFINQRQIREEERSFNFSILGLDFDENNLSIINQLKNQKIIKKRVFSVLYGEQSLYVSSKYDGQIIFGVFPHQISEKYDENILVWLPVTKNNNINQKWQSKFDKVIFYNEENSLNNIDFSIDLGLYLMIGPEELRQKFLENYFNELIKKKVCTEEYYFNKRDDTIYTFYSCSGDLDISNFPTLSFYMQGQLFKLTVYNLLCDYKGMTFFKIIFKREKSDKWVFGRSFMELFPTVFDVDNKKIGIYRVKLQENHPIYVFILFFIVIVTLVGYSIKGMINERKMKNEYANKKNDDINNKKDGYSKIPNKEKKDEERNAKNGNKDTKLNKLID